ncbi:hypothetical protein BDF22DRAFT_726616 [Syncephalis plumigaleata]|nr:hypothetical protein BDF22DRAFT_726616 [Syncephalis plumigaleata]
MTELREHHSTPDSLLVAVRFNTIRYDHPGGTELLLAFAGQDITRVLSDPDIHVHSSAAYKMLESYCVGWLIAEDGHAKTDDVSGGNSNATITDDDAFLSFNEPLFYQMWTSSFTKEEYMREVHRPRYLPYSARLFGSSLLEPLSLTPWWVVPIVWLPVIYYLFMWGATALYETSHSSTSFVYALFAMGMGTWTLMEYSLHRFIFHAEKWVPDRTWALTLHFIVHGVHHFLPMDRMRLVMPPALAIMIAYPLYSLVALVAPSLEMANVFFSGTLLGYVLYDLTHYYLHHGRPLGEHLRVMKSYHLAHHYKDANLGYGITSKLWDRAFNTLLA